MTGKLCIRAFQKLFRAQTGRVYLNKHFTRNISISHSRYDEKDIKLDSSLPPPPSSSEISIQLETPIQKSVYEKTMDLYGDDLYNCEDYCVLKDYKDYHIHKRGDGYQNSLRILKMDFIDAKHATMRFFNKEVKEPKFYEVDFFQEWCDILVIGGGAMGASCGYFLKTLAPHGTKVLVIDKDPTYKTCATTLSVGGLRQQFSLPESIEMSLFGADFIRTMGRSLAIDGYPPPEANFEPYGYLVLASEEGAATLKANSDLQRSLGAKNTLLSPNKLKERFPWINVNGIELGCLGLKNEGWFDPWSLLDALKKKSIRLGAVYADYELIGIEFEAWKGNSMRPTHFDRPLSAICRRKDGRLGTVDFAHAVICAGAESGRIGRFFRMGLEGGIMRCPIPVEPRKRYVYCVHCPDGPGIDTPLVVDPNGTYFRREGLRGDYICGVSPTEEEEPPTDNLDVDYDFFDNRVWPSLANRVPAFEKLKLKSAWSGCYEYNYFDQNGIIGRHPLLENIFMATGFSGHGIQHAPAVGRAIAELIYEYQYMTIDCSRLGFDRFLAKKPLLERNIF